MPAVSVIVPSYNVTKYIKQALDSVWVQTFQDFEVVVVNDGCPDTAALEQVLEPVYSRIRYIKQDNAGVAAACNTAIQAANSPLILHLDPDDWLEPNCIESQVEAIRPGLDAVYCNTMFTGVAEWDGKCWMDRYPSNGPVTFLSVIESRTCPTKPGSIVRRDTLFRIGLYDVSLRSWEDYDLWLRILKATPTGKMSFNPQPLVHYRLHQSSLTMQPRYMEYALQVLNKAEASFELSDSELAALNRRRNDVRMDLELQRGKNALRGRRWSEAREHFAYCVAHRPNMKIRGVVAALQLLPDSALNLAVKLIRAGR